MLYRGLALLASGEIGSGVALQDEAAATVLAGGISPWVGGLVYCGVIWSCRNRGDWRRAAEWTDHFTRWCQRAGMATFPGTCRLHRAEVLSIRGEQQEAESEVTEACAQLALSAPWAEGDAYRILGDLRLARGELEAADAAFRRAHELGWDPQPGLALLCLRRGQHDAALRGLERSLDDAGWANRQRRGLLLAHLVMVAAEAGAHVRAQACLDELDAHPELWATLAHGAAVARARAELATALGECPAAIRHLPRAIQLWREVGSPLNVAVTQLRLAEPLMTTGDRHAAELEIAAAEAVFDHAAASRLKARCAELRAQLHPTGC